MKLIFTLTAGRTGTAYLARLLAENIPQGRIHHEHFSPGAFGTEVPEISHMHAFNYYGNVEMIKAFWRQKLARILKLDTHCYGEMAHMLMKVGLVENMQKLAKEHEIHFILLSRRLDKSLISYWRRADFANLSLVWLFYLHPVYPKNILRLKKEKFKEFKELWYLYEIATRAHYYRLKYADEPNLNFHQCCLEDLNDPTNVQNLLQNLKEPRTLENIVIPPPINTMAKERAVELELMQKAKALLANLPCDPEKLARQFLLLEKKRQSSILPEEIPNDN